MDAYNRGYAPGINNLGKVGSQVGEATLLGIKLPTGSEAVGFYAAAYTVDGGGTIISYRGTDQNEPNWWLKKWGQLHLVRCNTFVLNLFLMNLVLS